MILWTIAPLESVLEGADDPKTWPKLRTIRYRGVEMVVEETGERQVRIHRLLSPVPSDYLKYLPGQMVAL